MNSLSFKPIAPGFGAVVEGFDVDEVPTSVKSALNELSIVLGCSFFRVLN
jgi:hypothetical protein